MATNKKRTNQKRAFNEQAYDRLAITVPRGAKSALEEKAQKLGTSINGLVNDVLAEKMGVDTLKVFSIKITEREPIISANTGKLMNDTELGYLDGIKTSVVKKKANKANDALHIAAKDYEKDLDENPDNHLSGEATLEVVGVNEQ